MSDSWSSREKLYLACAVEKTGENNWATICKYMRTMSDNDRPADFYSQKVCARQYEFLVESLALPRRKRTDTTTASSDLPLTATQVVEKLREQRMEELKHIVQQERNQFKKLNKEIISIKGGQLDHQIPVMLEQKLREQAANAPLKPLLNEELEAPSPSLPINILASPARVPDQEVIDITKSPRVPSTPKQIENAEIVGAVSTPIQIENRSPIIGSPRTPSSTILYPSSEFVSPSKTPSLLVVKPSTPLVSPSLSPSGPAMAIQGALLSPAKSVSHSPPRAVENQSLQLILQKLRPPSPAAADTNAAASALMKGMSEVVLQVEKLDASQIAAATIEDSDSEDEEKPLATLKSPPAAASPAKSGEITAPPVVEQAEPVVAPEATAPPQPKLEPLKIKVDQRGEKGSPPKRIQPARETSKAATRDRRKKHSGGSSTTSSDASGAVRTPAPSSRSPLPLPAAFPDLDTYKQWKKMVLNAWEQAAGHRHAGLFLQPVKDSIAPGYSTSVKRPTDLMVIKRNIENGTLTKMDDIQHEFLMMFANAKMYNGRNTEVHEMAHEMAIDVLKLLDDLQVSINGMFSGTGVEAVKTLRGNRQRHAPPAPPMPTMQRRSQAPKQMRINPDDETMEEIQVTKRKK